MKYRGNLNSLLKTDRKMLYIIFSVVLILLVTLSVAYAALSTTLNITGNAEVSAANWDIYFDNILLDSGSVSNTVPTIVDGKKVTFSATLEKPGDYYKFTVDIVNNGSIDAMIDSIEKLPELTSEQAKYIKYEIDYSDGVSINTSHLLAKGTSKKVRVNLRYRTDIISSDLPSGNVTLNLSFTVRYTQADVTSSSVPSNPIKIVSGNGSNVGDVLKIADEEFYVIENNGDLIKLLSKYNLYVGYVCTSNQESSCTAYGNEATGLQDSTMLGYVENGGNRTGTIRFSDETYWEDDINPSTYEYRPPVYVYNENSALYTYVENYKVYLEEQNVDVVEARLISFDELTKLGCSMENGKCNNSQYSWVYSSGYWSGSADSDYDVWAVNHSGSFVAKYYPYLLDGGVRPVIVISASDI